MQIKFVRHFESIRKNTWCKLKLLDIFCGITAGFAYRRTSDFAFKNARREINNEKSFYQQVTSVLKSTRDLSRNQHHEFKKPVSQMIGKLENDFYFMISYHQITFHINF